MIGSWIQASRTIFKRSIFGLVLVVHMSGFSSVYTQEKLDEEYPGNYSWLEKTFPGYQKLSIGWLQKLIEDNSVKSIEQLLPLLPEALRKSFTLMRKTRSLQDSDALNPRAILFAPDSRFIIAFNGAAYQRRFQQLEVLDYTASDGSARFYEIDFSKHSPEVSEPNPAVCMKCHSSYPRPGGEAKPIWTNYSRWFGSYGEVDDKIQPREKDDFREFLSSAEIHPRYKWLIRDTEKSEYAPFYMPKRYEIEDPRRGLASKYEDNGVNIGMRNAMFMPNIRLAKTLDARNAVRLAKRIEATELYQEFPFTTLFSMTCDNKKTKHAHRNRTDLLPDGVPSFTADDFGIDPNDFTILFSDSMGSYTNGNHHFSTSALIAGYFAQKLLGNSTNESLRVFYRPSFWRDYYGSFGVPKSFDARKTETYRYVWSWGYLLDSLAVGFSKTGYVTTKKSDLGIEKAAPGYAWDHYCAAVANEAKKEVVSKEDKVEFAMEYRGRFVKAFYGKSSISGRPKRDLSAILHECADCHDSSNPGVDFAPYIPFANPSALALMLRSEQREEQNVLVEKVKYRISSETKAAHVGGGQMPLGRRELEPSEAEVLVQYLEGLIEKK
jgi:hypothetical protein